MDISSIYEYPVLTAATVPASPAYVYASPLKYWARPLLAGEQESDPFTYQFYSPAGVLSTNTISKGAAAVANVPPASIPAGAPASNETIVPPPVNPALLPAGAVVVQNPMAIFGGLPLIQLPTVTSATSGTIATEDPNIEKVLTVVESMQQTVNTIQTQITALVAGVQALLSAA